MWTLSNWNWIFKVIPYLRTLTICSTSFIMFLIMAQKNVERISDSWPRKSNCLFLLEERYFIVLMFCFSFSVPQTFNHFSSFPFSIIYIFSTGAAAGKYNERNRKQMKRWRRQEMLQVESCQEKRIKPVLCWFGQQKAACTPVNLYFDESLFTTFELTQSVWMDSLNT